MKPTTVSFAPQNQLSSNSIKLISPFSGKVRSLQDHPEAIFQFGILGPGIMIELNKHKILAPFDGKLVTVRNAGTEFILQANNGLKVLLNLYFGQHQALTHRSHIAQINTSKVKQGQQIAYFDLRELKQPLLASLTILNAPKNYDVFYSLNHVDAGEDILLTLTKK